MKKPQLDINHLETKAIEIYEKAQGLQTSLPTHLKLVPEIRKTLSLVHDMSEVLLCLTQQQGEGHHGNDD